MGEETLQHHFPSIYEFCKSNGLDIATEMIPVAPAAHYFMGGILTGRWGETTLPGLFACGEVAANGVHGANRLASNSLLEGLVYGKRIYDYTATGAGTALDLAEYRKSSPLPLFVNTVSLQTREKKMPTLAALQNLMWEKVGLTREAEGLRFAVAQLESWEAALNAASLNTQAERELHNLVTVGYLVAYAALMREESRGAHYRLDFPQIEEKWQGRLVLLP
jgi:L-aspartate oxidase